MSVCLAASSPRRERVDKRLLLRCGLQRRRQNVAAADVQEFFRAATVPGASKACPSDSYISSYQSIKFAGSGDRGGRKPTSAAVPVFARTEPSQRTASSRPLCRCRPRGRGSGERRSGRAAAADSSGRIRAGGADLPRRSPRPAGAARQILPASNQDGFTASEGSFKVLPVSRRAVERDVMRSVPRRMRERDEMRRCVR